MQLYRLLLRLAPRRLREHHADETAERGASHHRRCEVLVGSLGVASTGIIIGLVLSLGTSRLFERLLFGIAPHDPRVLTFTSLVLLVLSALANLWPALRAGRVGVRP